MITKEAALKDVDLAISLLEKTKEEIQKCPYEKMTTSLAGQWSLAKIKRNCVVVRELALEVKNGMEWDYKV